MRGPPAPRHGGAIPGGKQGWIAGPGSRCRPRWMPGRPGWRGQRLHEGGWGWGCGGAASATITACRGMQRLAPEKKVRSQVGAHVLPGVGCVSLGWRTCHRPSHATPRPAPHTQICPVPPPAWDVGPGGEPEAVTPPSLPPFSSALPPRCPACDLCSRDGGEVGGLQRVGEADELGGGHDDVACACGGRVQQTASVTRGTEREGERDREALLPQGKGRHHRPTPPLWCGHRPGP